MHFPFPAMVFDIGGTNVRMALIEAKNAVPVALAPLKTADFTGLGEAFEAICAHHHIGPRSVIACGAGPVVGRLLTLTNAPWTMDGPVLAERLGLEQGLLLNDFEAQALALPTVQPAWTHQIGPALPEAKGLQLILGPGTGLGIGAVMESGGQFIPLSSEACHIDFAPAGQEQELLWPALERVEGRVTTESVMSGPGLMRLHRARSKVLAFDNRADDPATLVERAHLDISGHEAATVRLFWDLIARFAGDMAITFLAKGGVTLSGGILPRLLEHLEVDAFRAQFEDKAPVARLTRSIPTQLLIASDAVLSGMAAIAVRPEQYAIDYASRAWR